MVLEWLRRRDPGLDRYLRSYLFTEAPIRERPGPANPAPEPGPARGPDLGVGSLRIRGAKGVR